MCEAALGIVVAPGINHVDRMKAILNAIPDATEIRTLISRGTRIMSITRAFWREVLGDEYDWEFVIKPNNMKKFFKHFSLTPFYERKKDNHFADIVVAYENLSTCTSEEVLLYNYSMESDICEQIPQIVAYNKEKILTTIFLCKTLIMTELHCIDIFTPEIEVQVNDAFIDLHSYFLQETSALLV